MRVAIARLFPSFLALLSAFFVISLGLLFSAAGPQRVLSALFEGAAGDTYRVAETLVKATPLLYTGLAVMIGLHVGVWNIGAEGQLLVGALATAWVGPYLTSWPPLIAIAISLTAAMMAGALWAAFPALLKQRRDVNEVISTIMLNFVALQLVSYCVHGPLMEPAGRYPQTALLPVTTHLPRLLPPTRLHLGAPLALGVAGASWFLLYRTKIGFMLRATGANLTAARLGGLPVAQTLILTFLLSGALAGLAGGVEVTGITQRVYEKFSPGYGYTAIAVALVGQGSPVGIVLAALLFGALEAGAGAVQRVAGISSVLTTLIQASIVFFLAAYSTPTIRRLFTRDPAPEKSRVPT